MPLEAGGERPEADQPDVETDLAHRPVGVTQQRRGPFEPTCHQVGLRRLAECAAELATEVRPRQSRGSRHVIDADRLGVAAVREIPCAQQVSSGRYRGHTARLSLTTFATGARVALRPGWATTPDASSVAE